MYKEIDPIRQRFDSGTLSTPDPCPGDPRHAYLYRPYENIGDYIILPRGALCGVVGLGIDKNKQIIIKFSDDTESLSQYQCILHSYIVCIN